MPANGAEGAGAGSQRGDFCATDALVSPGPSPPAPSDTAASASATWRLDEAHLEALRRQGFAVVDGCLSAEAAASLRHEAHEFVQRGRIKEHRFQFGDKQYTKPHIFEADLHDEALQQELPLFGELLFEDALVDSVSALIPELQLQPGPKAKTLKLQYNAGSGGCFPCHYDNAGRPSRRALTCIVYLNPDWKDGDGGELELLPFLAPKVRVRPLMGRAVFFRSDLVFHRVCPANAERYCFSIWVDSDGTNRSQDCNLTASMLSMPIEECADFLRNSPVQRTVSRAVYAEMYEESLKDCMTGTDGCTEMLAAHLAHLDQQRSNPRLWAFIEALRSLRPATGPSVV